MNNHLSAKECKHCGSCFAPVRPMQNVCSPICASRLVKAAKKEQEEREKAKLKARKESVKSRQQWLVEAQSVVNKYVRLRDADKPCCSCDRPANWGGQWHASHYRSVGAASAVRFNLWNIHKGCSICNNHLSGNISGYRPRIIERIGLDRFEWLESQNQVVKYDIEYLKRLKAVFTKKVKRLEGRK